MAAAGYPALAALNRDDGWFVVVEAGAEQPVRVRAWKWLGQKPIDEEGESADEIAPRVIEQAHVIDLLMGVYGLHG